MQSPISITDGLSSPSHVLLQITFFLFFVTTSFMQTQRSSEASKDFHNFFLAVKMRSFQLGKILKCCYLTLLLPCHSLFLRPATGSADQMPLPPPEGSLFTAAGQAGSAASSLRQGHPDELEAACTGPHCESHPLTLCLTCWASVLTASMSCEPVNLTQ